MAILNEERKARMDWRIRVVRAEEEWKKRKIEIGKRMERIFVIRIGEVNRKNKNEEKVEKLTNRKEEDV